MIGFDDSANILYYNSGGAVDGRVVIYDVKAEKQLRTISISSGVMYMDEDYVYLNSLSSNKFDIYNKKSYEVSSLNISDYSPYTMSIPQVAKYNGSLYLLMGSYGKLIEYSDSKESYVLEGGYLEFVATKEKLYIVDSGQICVNCLDQELKYYEYDIKAGVLEQSSNQYMKDLFEYNSIYYLA